MQRRENPILLDVLIAITVIAINAQIQNRTKTLTGGVMTPCKVCGYCPCCGKLGQKPDAFFDAIMPKRAKELEKHYQIFPEHKTVKEEV